jgi:hypothetical protein
VSKKSTQFYPFGAIMAIDQRYGVICLRQKLAGESVIFARSSKLWSMGLTSLNFVVLLISIKSILYKILFLIDESGSLGIRFAPNS